MNKHTTQCRHLRSLNKHKKTSSIIKFFSVCSPSTTAARRSVAGGEETAGGALTRARRRPRGRSDEGARSRGGVGEARRRHGGATTYGSWMTRRWRDNVRLARRRWRRSSALVPAPEKEAAAAPGRCGGSGERRRVRAMSIWRRKKTIRLNSHGDL